MEDEYVGMYDLYNLNKVDIIFLLKILKETESKIKYKGETYIPSTKRIKEMIRNSLKESFVLSRKPNIKKTIEKLKDFGLIEEVKWDRTDDNGSIYLIPEKHVTDVKIIVDLWFKRIIDLKPYKDVINESDKVEFELSRIRKEINSEKENLENLKRETYEKMQNEMKKLDKPKYKLLSNNETVTKAIIAYVSLTEKQRKRIPFILGCIEKFYDIGNGYKIYKFSNSLDPEYSDDAHIIRILDMRSEIRNEHYMRGGKQVVYFPKDERFANLVLYMCITENYPIDFLKLVNPSSIVSELEKRKHKIEKEIEKLEDKRKYKNEYLKNVSQEYVHILNRKKQLVNEITKPISELSRRMNKMKEVLDVFDVSLGDTLKHDINRILNNFDIPYDKKTLKIKIESGEKIEELDEKYEEFFTVLRPNEIEISLDELVLPERIKEVCKHIKVLKNKEKIKKIKRAGVSGYNKILFAGASGTGKTEFAKACAKEIDVEILVVKTNQLIDKYLGETSKNVEKVLKYAKNKKPCIVFWDEIDDLLRDRKMQGDSSASTEMRRTLNTLLREIEKIKIDDQIILMFATNLPEELDQAFNRRVNQTVIFTIPEKYELRKIYETKLGRIEDIDEINYDEIVDESYLFTGGNVKQVIDKSFNISLIEGRSLQHDDIIKAIKEIRSGINISDMQRIQEIWKNREKFALSGDKKKKESLSIYR